MRSLLLSAALMMVAGCSSSAPSNYDELAADMRSAVQASTLRPGDVVHVRVYLHKEMSGDYEVSRRGQINFPLLGLQTIEGLTAAQVALKLQRQLRQGYIRNPHVIVSVKKFSSKKVFVLGQVKKPGRFQYSDNMTIVEAITLAGGFNAMAEKNYIIVTRGPRRIPVPVEKITQGLARNFTLRPGDIVYVPQTIL